MSFKRKRDEESAGVAPVSQPPSALRMEDTAFPRGGASTVLTPLEIKQATNEATRDLFTVRFYWASESNAANGKKKSKKQHRNKVHQKSEAGSDKAGEKHKIKVESLSFGKLTAGSVVLGQVVQINTLDIALSLPNNLLGYVPITNISAKLSERISKAEDDDESGSEDEDNEDSDLPQLSQLFKVGQWLRALVVENEKVNNKKRIELSIDPLQVNEEIETDDLVAGIAVQGSVQSVEDHGIIVDIGRDDVSGFLSNKELSHAGIEASSLGVGQVLLLTILSKSANGRTVTLTASATAKKMTIVKAVTLNKSLLAGTLVEVLITDIRSNGLVGKVFGSIDATIDIVHSGIYDRAVLEQNFKEGKVVKGRVIYSPPAAVSESDDENSTKVFVSLLETTIELKVAEDGDALPIGQILEAKVKIVDANGLYVDIGTKSLGFVHVSRVADKRIEDLSIEEAYSVGTTHPARILNYNYADNLYIVSTEKSVIEQKYLRVEDVSVGEKVTGTVDRILPKGGVLIKLWEGFSGIANDIHLSDIKLAHPEKKFKPGMKVTARVSSIICFKVDCGYLRY
ncbi:Rrp5p [Sugiyamaella lignohabitans]|uniref:rRNA biogenesis protein RRP5 n=1 Tax=Sugiyamaella lignohabitans TaxID=796027 RepID=A0A161HH06_9ASCO|nr:Rrp5p [Sugiyamaella lignohabitans]ANB11217.1 Rrp5p [Sugiyamaella lignohabitans]